MISQNISPCAEITTETGDVQSTSYEGSAPLRVRFLSGSDNHDGYFEWRFYKNEVIEGQHYLLRHEENTEFTFTEAGVHLVCLYVSFPDGEEMISDPISITVKSSKLEFPNAFSPNGDQHNDVYKAKDGYQSIVDFKATIYNRWGQKLYEWTNLEGGWDGTYRGNDVKQGTYFVLVKAKGADGQDYNIRKDVNLLRGYTEGTSNSQ